MEKSDLTKYLNMIRRKKGSVTAESSSTKKSSSCQEASGTDYSIYKLTGSDFIKQGSIGLLLCAVIAYTFYKSILVFIFLIPAGVIFFPLSRRDYLKSERLWRLMLEFREAMWSVSGFLSAGFSVVNAFLKTHGELCRMYGNDSMMAGEFASIIRQIRLNVPVEAALGEFAGRSGVDDIKNFSAVFSIARRRGGNMKEIIENTTRVMRDKTTVNEEIKNMTASRRYEQKIMNLLPFMIIIYIDLSTEGFLDVMYDCFAGRVIMTICLIMLGVSYMLSQRILEIKV